MEHHESALPMLAISIHRIEVEGFTSRIGAGDVPFADWWSVIAKLKGIGQWKTKIQDSTPRMRPKRCRRGECVKIGQLLFQHLTSGGAWSAGPPNELPAI